MNIKIRLRFIAMALVAVALVLPLPAFLRVVRYTQAASAGQRMIEALRSGILILVIPPTLGSVGMIFLLHRKRNQVRRTESTEFGQQW